MNKVIPFLMVIAFWSIFYWGQSNPKVRDAIIALAIVGITVFIITIGKKILWDLIANSK